MDSKINNIVHSHLGKIFTTNRNFKSGIFALKGSLNFEAICKTADKVLESSNSFHKYLYGNPLPQDLENLGALKFVNYETKSIENEINWFLLSVRKYKAELSLFTTYKKEFEGYFLIGEYTKAFDIAEKCILHIGYSNWAINAKLLVYEYTGAQEKAKILLTEVLQKSRSGIFTTSLVNFLGQRSERKLSAYKFDSDFKNTILAVKSNLSDINKDFYKFHLSFFEFQNYNELKDVLGFSYCNSIIDRYLTFRRILFYCIANSIELEFIISRLPYFLRRIPDELFNTFLLFVNPTIVGDNFYDINYLKIIDLFYSGLHEEVIIEIKKEILKQPENFTLINLYSRSLVFLNRPFENLIETQCLVNEIAENIYKINKRSANPAESIYSLYQISKNINDFDINYQLDSFIKKEQKMKHNENYFFMSLLKADPKIADIITEKENIPNIKLVLEKIVSKTYDSISVKYKLNSLDDDFDSLTEISSIKSKLDSAKSFYERKEYEKSLTLWEEINKENSHIPPIYEAAVEHIFNILVETGKLDESIEWFVDSYIKNQYSINKIDATEIHKILKKGRFKNIKITIHLPIFISLISGDENEKSFATELYCKINDAIIPSELIENNGIPKNKYLELFFFHACNNENLKHYRNINTTKKRLEERIHICTFLTKQFPEKQTDYIEELNLLTNELIIYEGTQKLDESKIYANDQAILTKELAEFEGLYNRYVTIAGLYLKNIKILTVNRNELRFLNKKNETDYSQNDVEYSEQAHLDAFYNLFSEIRNKFLFSKFGIVTYLSTRIRHGVFLGELRPELEKHNLIFFKNKLRDRYEPTDFWTKDSSLRKDEKEQLNNLIINFSDQIDTLINSIIKDNIQIRLNDENPDGWFDYEYEYIELGNFSVTFFYEENYSAFCKKSLEKLWERTDINLQDIRKILQDEVKDKFSSIISNFEYELQKLLGKDKLPEIFSAVAACSTNIQNRIDKIAAWFKRSGRTHSDFKINMLINIICAHVQRSYPQKSLSLHFESDFDLLIKGEYYEHFNDFLRNFIDNMLKHSEKSKINCTITIKTKGNIVEIIIENETSENKSEIPVGEFGMGQQIDGIKLITENKSGLIKSRKIIKDDLGNENNDVYVNNENNKFRVTASINYLDIIA